MTRPKLLTTFIVLLFFGIAILAGAGNCAPFGVLCRAGYLDVYDTLYAYGDEIEWRLEFTTANNYTISYRKEETEPWHADGTGSRLEDSISDSRAVYVLRNWWDSTLLTFPGETVTFRTRRSPDMIEVPVVFHSAGGAGAVAYSNNVVNCLVDGSGLVVANVFGPIVAGENLFNKYVDSAARLVGFSSVIPSEERVYHNWFGSIHCGTNVLREIPALYWWDVLP